MDSKSLAKSLSNLDRAEIAGGAIGFSLLVALVTMAILRLIRRPGGKEQPATSNPAEASAGDTSSIESERVPPIQPIGDREVPMHVPNHFSEGVVIPGLTETGVEVEEQDVIYGRSPEGI